MPLSRILLILFVVFTGKTIAQPTDTGEYKGLLNENYLDDRDTLIENIWIDSLHENFALFADFKHKKACFLKNVHGKNIPSGTFDIQDTWLMSCLRFEDLNADGIYEIMLGSGRNMNGNQWFNVFKYDSTGDSIVFAGKLNTDYTIDTVNKAIKVEYEGSWYMDVYKALYKWRGNKLILEKQVVQILKVKDMEHDAMWIDYYTNPTHTSNGLKRIIHETWNAKNKKQQDLWEDFFNQP